MATVLIYKTTIINCGVWRKAFEGSRLELSNDHIFKGIDKKKHSLFYEACIILKSKSYKKEKGKL